MANGIIYTKSLGKTVAEQAKGTIGRYHVIPFHQDKWNVVADGSLRPFKTFSTMQEAVTFAKRYASSTHMGEVIIHNADGKVLSRISY